MVTEAVIQDVMGNVIEDVVGVGGPVVPPILATALVWHDETTHILSGLDVIGWSNKGTTGALDDLLQFQAAAGTLTQGVINGLPSILHIGGVPGMLRVDGTQINGPWTMYSVKKMDAIPTSNFWAIDSFDNIANIRFAHQVFGDASQRYRIGYPLIGGITNLSPLDTNINTVIADNDSNGTGNVKFGAFAPTTFSTNAGDGIKYGAHFAERNGINFVTVPYHKCEFLLFAGVQTDAVHTEILDYLRNKWGAL